MTKKILVVDDDLDIRSMVELRLEMAGYEVVFATDGRTGVEVAFVEQPDLVLLDKEMPGMDGPAVAQELRTRGFTSVICGLTAADDNADHCRVCDHLIQKPLPDDFEHQIASLLAKGGVEQ